MTESPYVSPEQIGLRERKDVALTVLKQELLKCAERLGGECAFVIKNLRTGETLSHRETLTVPSASLIKVPVMIEIMRQVKSGELALDRRFTVEPEDIVPYSVLEFLDSGNRYTLLDLLKLTTVYSDNTAANLLIDLAGMDRVNAGMRALGLTETTLNRKMMDFAARKTGLENMTTAGEMAQIMLRLYAGELLGREYDEQILAIMKGQADECMMRVDLPDDLPIARKSGELECLNHEMAVVYTDHGDYLYVFFVWGTATNNDSREILQRTSKTVFDCFNK